MAQVLILFISHPRSYSWRVSFDLTSFSVLFSHLELFSELDNPIVMASLRYSAAEESEGTMNAFTSPTWKIRRSAECKTRVVVSTVCDCVPRSEVRPLLV